MEVEIEAKLKVDSLGAVEEKLSQIGGEFIEQQRQIDSYFDDAEGSFKAGDGALRIRRQQAGEVSKVYLTYKGPKAADNFKKRDEIDIEVDDADKAEEMLCALGYSKAISFEKKRGLWRLGNCTVALDEVALLGNFVEIEGSDDERIADVQRRLGLTGLKHIPKSYASLVEGRLKELGRGDREVLL